MHHPFEQHPTVAGIICVCAGVFMADVTGVQPVPAEEYGVIPTRVIQAWSELTSGDISAATPGILMTNVTGIFLHGGPPHLLMNMAFLWLFGSLISMYLGRWWALGAFFICGIGGFILHILLNRESDIPCIGASGAITGFEGIYFGLAMRWRLSWPDVWPLAHPVPPGQLAVFAAIGIGADFIGLTRQAQGVAFGAHIGGFLTGLVIAAIVTQLCPSVESFERFRR